MPSIFLSHSSSDKSFVRHLANQLASCNVKVWFDEAEMRIGDSLLERIGHAIEEADYVAVILSRQSINSKWVQLELQMAIEKEFQKEHVVVLPILLENVTMPPFLSGKYYADFTSFEQYEISFSKILDTLGISAESRALFDYLIRSDESVYYLGDTPIHKYQPFHIYYHMDMDGIGSAVMLALYLNKKHEHSIDEFVFIPVDFDIDKNWHQFNVKQPSAILDFLYHPNALVYFDHHQHPFVTEQFKKDYYSREGNTWIKLDKHASSVVDLLFHELDEFFQVAYPGRYEDLEDFVRQIDRIDTGQYEIASSWSTSETYCDKINLILNNRRTANFCNELIHDLLRNNPGKLFKRKRYRVLLEEAQQLLEEERVKIREALVRDNGVVLYDTVAPTRIPFYRFIPYEFFPDTHFVVAIYTKESSYEVSVGKNPFQPPPFFKNIGEICQRFGGGGHEYVGGITVPSYRSAREIAQKVIPLLYPT